MLPSPRYEQVLAAILESAEEAIIARCAGSHNRHPGNWAVHAPENARHAVRNTTAAARGANACAAVDNGSQLVDHVELGSGLQPSDVHAGDLVGRTVSEWSANCGAPSAEIIRLRCCSWTWTNSARIARGCGPATVPAEETLATPESGGRVDDIFQNRK
jgi:hypothetical protein